MSEARALAQQDSVGQEVDRLAAEGFAAQKTTVEVAWKIGRLLSEKKAEIGHGGFQRWLTGNVMTSKRTCQNCMRFYELYKNANVAHLPKSEKWYLPRGKEAPQKCRPVPRVAKFLKSIRTSKSFSSAMDLFLSEVKKAKREKYNETGREAIVGLCKLVLGIVGYWKEHDNEAGALES